MEKKKTKIEEKEIDYGMQIQLASAKNEYITALINGRYFLARCNMIAGQLQTGKILENQDGAPKTEEYFRCEYALVKMQAINSMRTAHFAKLDLIKKYNLSEDDLQDIEKDYYDGKIIREEYDTDVKRAGKAGFVNED
ncbi:MAG: hypothetical protein ACTSU7_00190 [Candidatus Heimdallarchaeaceae archaeon]